MAKKNERFNSKKTIDLANKFGVTVNEETLSSLEVMNTTTVVYRYFGFGGKIIAVPLVKPNFEWVKEYMETFNEVQP